MAVAESLTTGVNYDPFTVDPASISSAHLDFRVSVTVGAEDVDLVGGLACGSGCRKQAGASGPEALGGERVDIVRFAKFGEGVIAGTPFRWLVTMEDGSSLSGDLEGDRDADGNLVYPARLRLSGRMIIWVQLEGSDEVVRLRSREEPVLEGEVPSWPPYGMRLSLASGPVDYYDEREIADESAQPWLRVTANDSQLGDEEYTFLREVPEIAQAASLSTPTRGGRRTVRLDWSRPSARVMDDLPVAHFNVYRTDDPADLDAWRLVGQTTGDVPVFVDATATEGSAYVLTQVAQLPFGYQFESLPSSPVRP